MRAILLCLPLLAASPAFAGEKEDFVGTWKLQSFVYEDVKTKERVPLFGQKPRGYQIATPEGRWIGLVAAENRPTLTAEAARQAGQGATISYSGRYRVEKGRVITKMDVSSNEAWVGSEQALSVRFESKDKLHLVTNPMQHPLDSNKTVRIIASWQRDKS